MPKEIYLRYKGGGFLGTIPTRDLTDAEAKQYGIQYLINSGLYELAHPPKQKYEPKKEGE